MPTEILYPAIKVTVSRNNDPPVTPSFIFTIVKHMAKVMKPAWPRYFKNIIGFDKYLFLYRSDTLEKLYGILLMVPS